MSQISVYILKLILLLFSFSLLSCSIVYKEDIVPVTTSKLLYFEKSGIIEQEITEAEFDAISHNANYQAFITENGRSFQIFTSSFPAEFIFDLGASVMSLTGAIQQDNGILILFRHLRSDITIPIVFNVLKGVKVDPIDPNVIYMNYHDKFWKWDISKANAN